VISALHNMPGFKAGDGWVLRLWVAELEVTNKKKELVKVTYKVTPLPLSFSGAPRHHATSKSLDGYVRTVLLDRHAAWPVCEGPALQWRDKFDLGQLQAASCSLCRDSPSFVGYHP